MTHAKQYIIRNGNNLSVICSYLNIYVKTSTSRWIVLENGNTVHSIVRRLKEAFNIKIEVQILECATHEMKALYDAKRVLRILSMTLFTHLIVCAF